MNTKNPLRPTLSGLLLAAILLGTTSTIAQPRAGDWKATTRFGQFVFTVASNRTEITKLATTFSSYTFGGITQNGTVISMPFPGWPVSNNQFVINNNISPTGSVRITINGTFVPAGDQASGTWTMVVNGQTDQGTWGPAVVTSVELVNAGTPERFFLGQNYPNPFNPRTTIRYELLAAADISLKVYSSLGLLIATLEDGRKDAGIYHVRWDANVPSGIYFYRLQATTTSGQAFVETRKAMVLR